MAKSNKPRFGLFYRSNGRWTGPYGGMTFTKYTITREPIASDIKYLKNYVLKSSTQIRKVSA